MLRTQRTLHKTALTITVLLLTFALPLRILTARHACAAQQTSQSKRISAQRGRRHAATGACLLLVSLPACGYELHSWGSVSQVEIS